MLLGEIAAGNKVTARGDWSGADVFFGEKYEFRYRFSRFKLMREIGGGKAAANAMRTQIRHAKLRYHETGFFEAVVTPEGRTPGAYKFDGTTIAVRNAQIGHPAGAYDPDTAHSYEGVFTIPIMSRGEQCTVELRNDSPHPCKFSTCEWVGMVTGRARSLQ